MPRGSAGADTRPSITGDFMPAVLLMARAPRRGEVRHALEPLIGLDGCVALQAALVELGMTSDQAAAAIKNGVTLAMAELANKFNDDLQREINSALGQDYLNEFADLMKKRQQALDDAARLGTGTALVDRWFQVQAQKIINDAGLAGSAIADLVALFPVLAGKVNDASSSLAEAAEKGCPISKLLDTEITLDASLA